MPGHKVAAERDVSGRRDVDGMNGSMRNFRRRCAAVIATLVGPFGIGLCGLINPALAQQVYAPRPWEMWMQPAGGPLKQQIINLHDGLLVIITLITLFVAALLVWVMWRYNAKRNPVPSQTSHNTALEIAWTLIPIVILVVMVVPSLRMVYYLDRTPDADLTIKVTGASVVLGIHLPRQRQHRLFQLHRSG